MCVDIHPKYPHMIVVGLVQGHVAVYNLRTNNKHPTHISSTRNGKHKDIVWQVGSFIKYCPVLTRGYNQPLQK